MRASRDKSEVGEWVTTLQTTKRTVARKQPRQMSKVGITSALGYIAIVVFALMCVKYIAGA